MFCNVLQGMLKLQPEHLSQNGVTGIKGLPTETIRPTKPKSSQDINTTKMAATRRISFSFGLICYLISLLSCSPCSDTPKSKAVSADGQLAANVYERNCGATTDFSSMVNVQKASDKFDGDEGRLFVANGRYDISVTWIGPRVLLIRCAACSRGNIFREVVVDGDIDVSYSLTSDSRK
jgi:hypothetical protein